MRVTSLLLSAALIVVPITAPITADAKSKAKGSALIDYAGFMKLTRELAPVRQKRLLSVEDFMAKAKATNAIILDARSERAFNAGHIDGAINVDFAEFTAKSLEEALGKDKKRPILIYCNNNFRDDRWPVASKVARVSLNVQTFVNLHAYGYTNVWELGEDIMTADARINWVGQQTAEPSYLPRVITTSQTAGNR
jgi:phage shock protein E